MVTANLPSSELSRPWEALLGYPIGRWLRRGLADRPPSLPLWLLTGFTRDSDSKLKRKVRADLTADANHQIPAHIRAHAKTL